MKIAVYSHSIPPAVDGVSRRFTMVVHELISAGHDVVLFTLEKNPELAIPEKERSRLRYVTMDSCFHPLYPSKRVAAPTFNNFLVTMDTLRRERPEVLHATMDSLGILFGLAGRLLGVPVVGSIHTDLQTGLVAVGASALTRWLINWKEQMEGRLLDGMATTSPSFKRKLGRQGILCDHVVKTGVRVNCFTPEARCAETRNRLTFGNPEGLLLVYVGRLAPEKDLDLLVSMCGSVKGVYLALIGDGPLGGYLGSLHGPNKNQGGLYCVPSFLSHEELPRIYASSDLHVSSSVFETLGNTVLEAHACGIPVVVPRAQGFIDTVTDKVDGFLFDGTRPAEGRRLLCKLRDDRNLCRTMGMNGRAKVLKQSPDLVTRDMVEWYKGSIAKHQELGALVALGKALQLTVYAVVVMLVWALYDLNLPRAALHGLTRACHNTRNMVGNSSFFNRVSNTYKALTNIPVEREARQPGR